MARVAAHVWRVTAHQLWLAEAVVLIVDVRAELVRVAVRVLAAVPGAGTGSVILAEARTGAVAVSATLRGAGTRSVLATLVVAAVAISATFGGANAGAALTNFVTWAIPIRIALGLGLVAGLITLPVGRPFLLIPVDVILVVIGVVVLRTVVLALVASGRDAFAAAARLTHWAVAIFATVVAADTESAQTEFAVLAIAI